MCRGIDLRRHSRNSWRQWIFTSREVRELTISLLCTKNLSYYHRRIQTIKRKKTIKNEQVMIMMTFERVVLIFY